MTADKDTHDTHSQPSDTLFTNTSLNSNEYDGNGNDDNDSIHTHTTNEAFFTVSTTSSTSSSSHSDLKKSGSNEHDTFVGAEEEQEDADHTLQRPSASLPPSPDTEHPLTPRNALLNVKEDSNGAAVDEDIKRLSRVRSGTLGGRKISTPPTFLDTDHDTCTITSDMEESAFFDYGEEMSEYVPPLTPKVGGFGVETAKMEPHREGMRSAASERVNKTTQGIVKKLYSAGFGDSWGANFWCIIEQPNDRSFFANPETGECAWAVPPGTFVLPPRPEGQWWELYDETRKLSYYFHTKSKLRQWERPKGFIIPLAAIQESTLGKRFSRIELKGGSMASAGIDSNEVGSSVGLAERRSPQPHPPRQSPKLGKRQSTRNLRQSTTRNLQGQKRYPQSISASFTETADLWEMRRQTRSRLATGLSTIPSSTDLQAAASRSNSTINERKHCTNRPHTSNGEAATGTSSGIIRSRVRRQSFDLESLSSVEIQKPFRRERDPVKRRLYRAFQDSPEPTICSDPYSSTELGLCDTIQDRRLPLDQIGRKRSVSLDDCHGPASFPTGGVASFSYQTFVEQHYAKYRIGFFRRKCPLHRLMQWQKEPIRNPLLPLEKAEHKKDAIRIFQIILRYCGDRINPVFWPTVPGSSDIHATDKRTGACLKEKREYSGPSVEEEVKWMLERVINAKELRNEMYAQLMKQIIGNKGQVSLHKAWSLLSIALSFIPPSTEYITAIHRFIQQNGYNRNARDIGCMATYSLSKLHRKSNQTVKTISLEDIEAVEFAAVRSQLVYHSLEELLEILALLATEMLKRDCLSTVDVFRRAGDSRVVHALRRRISHDPRIITEFFSRYETSSQSDKEEVVYILASTFRLMLAEMGTPLFPATLYSDCLKASQVPSNLIEVCGMLDKTRCRIVIVVITFLQLFCPPAIVAQTRVDIKDISFFFAPSLLRSIRQQELEINCSPSYHEALFVESLLRYLPCHQLDGDFLPSFLDSCGADTQRANTRAKMDSSPYLGVGGNGVGLTPRIRKVSAAHSRDA